MEFNWQRSSVLCADDAVAGIHITLLHKQNKPRSLTKIWSPKKTKKHLYLSLIDFFNALIV